MATVVGRTEVTSSSHTRGLFVESFFGLSMPLYLMCMVSDAHMCGQQPGGTFGRYVKPPRYPVEERFFKDARTQTNTLPFGVFESPGDIPDL